MTSIFSSWTLLSQLLADSSTQIVEAIWPLSSVICRSELGSKAVLPLRTFIQETLRRSRTSYSTLQVALYYLILIKPHVPHQNFTMEQPEDRHSGRALQCGRRMFLAALILASKYLQDRNYSARAWSKISGLNTQEINQNEIAFLLSVNWKLHIADEVFQRWTEIVLKYTPPPSPPSPGGVSQPMTQQTADWKRIILGLNTELTNIEELFPARRISLRLKSDLLPLSPRSILNMTQEGPFEATPVPTSISAPMIMEPTPTCVYTNSRLAPNLGMLPTPGLPPQPSGFCTPAVSNTSQRTSMGMAMSQANSAGASQYPSISFIPSPQNVCSMRRSSLANSFSSVSSPESMVSDSSRVSRSSSISSASSLASATANNKLSFASRSRVTKLVNERLSTKPSIRSVPEDCFQHRFTSSPESYAGPVGRLGERSMDTLLTTRERFVRDAASDAARILQELHNQRAYDTTPTGSKRNRAPSMDTSLQENVRDMLSGHPDLEPTWSKSLLRSQGIGPKSYTQTTVAAADHLRSTKRLCCSAEAVNGYEAASGQSVLGIPRHGMWLGILN